MSESEVKKKPEIDEYWQVKDNEDHYRVCGFKRCGHVVVEDSDGEVYWHDIPWFLANCDYLPDCIQCSVDPTGLDPQDIADRVIEKNKQTDLLECITNLRDQMDVINNRLAVIEDAITGRDVQVVWRS